MTRFYSEPITTLDEGKAYLDTLYKVALTYHLEDDATDILWPKGKVTEEMAEALNDRSDELYELKWEEFGCPIGYLLHLEGL